MAEKSLYVLLRFSGIKNPSKIFYKIARKLSYLHLSSTIVNVYSYFTLTKKFEVVRRIIFPGFSMAQRGAYHLCSTMHDIWVSSM